MKSLWLKITISLMLVAFVGVGAWATIDKLDDSTFRVIVGVLLTLLIVVVVGALFIGKDLLQAYIINRAIAQDDIGDLKQMAMLFRLMGNSRGTTIKMPQLPQGNTLMLPNQQQQPLDVAYRDVTTASQDIEIE